MAQFEYLGIAFGLLYTAASLRLISGAPYALRAGARDWLHSGFLVAALVGIAVNFWKFGALGDVAWTLPRFLLALTLPASIYMVAVSLVPEDAYNVESWRDHFLAMRVPFFFSLSLVGLVVAAHRILLLGEPPEPAPLVLPFIGVAGTLSKDIRLLGLLMLLVNVVTFIEVVRPTANPWS